MPLVAVYGSLKKGFHNHDILADSRFVGRCTTQPVYRMHDLGAFPAITEQGRTRIHVEVYDVSDRVLQVLDMLEGHPRFYRRTMIRTEFGDTFIYVMPREVLPDEKNIVQSGVWTVDAAA